MEAKSCNPNMFFRVMCWCKTPTKTTWLPSPATTTNPHLRQRFIHLKKRGSHGLFLFAKMMMISFVWLMAEILHQLRLVISRIYLQGFSYIPGGAGRISSINSSLVRRVMSWIMETGSVFRVDQEFCRKTFAPYSRCRSVFLWHDKKTVVQTCKWVVVCLCMNMFFSNILCKYMYIYISMLNLYV